MTTNGEIAGMLGKPRSSRVVGWAMQKAPSDRRLPCHRVVAKDGSLAPGYAFGGQHIQRERLEKENITFDANGKIQMRKHIWDPEL